MLTITSACKHPEEAWEFLRFYLSAAGTKDGAFMAQGGFSLLNETFEQQLDDCMYIMFDGRSDAEYYEDDGSKIYPMTQEERDTVEAYIRSCDKLCSISELIEFQQNDSNSRETICNDNFVIEEKKLVQLEGERVYPAVCRSWLSLSLLSCT